MTETTKTLSEIQWGHFGIIMLAAVLLLGMTWLKNPELLSLNKNKNLASTQMLHYVPYVPSAEDLPQPAVLGASTSDGPQIIGDDGTVHSVDLGQVLGASTKDVQLSLDEIKVNSVPDSQDAIRKYFSDAQTIEGNMVSNTDFAGALNSGDQTQINIQAQKIITVRDALQKLSVPQSLVKLQKLKIIQYDSSVSLLQNFTLASQNPDQISSNMQEFLKSQQDLDTENIIIAQKFPQEDPQSGLYINPDGSSAISQTSIDNFGSSTGLPSQDSLENLNGYENVGQ